MCFRTTFVFHVALTKKQYLLIQLFPLKIGPNWPMGLGETTVGEEGGGVTPGVAITGHKVVEVSTGDVEAPPGQKVEARSAPLL